MHRLQEHYDEALQYFDEDRIVGIFCQGSQNYGLDYENSDVDSKLVVIPSLDEIIFNKKPVSTTHIMKNDEHIDFKDIRLMFQTFRKQNINFIEILFTEFKIINPKYKPFWDKLVAHREDIAHYNMFLAIKAMKGMAYEKHHAMEHRYPTKADIIDKYGYDGKQLHHMVRLKNFIYDYMNLASYEDCLDATKDRECLLMLKRNGLTLEEARTVARNTLDGIEALTINMTKESIWNSTNEEVDVWLNAALSDIIKAYLKDKL